MSNSNRLMLDMQASDTNAVPYELFDASQAQLREAAVALTKHKSSLASALGEVNNLRAMVSALETNVETLKIQNDDLFDKLRESRRNEETLIVQVTKLTDTTELLSHQLQLHAKTAAQRYSNLLEMKEEAEAALRLRLDRVSDQLVSSQQPQTRVIPWSYTFKQTDHPAHIVKLVVQADASRENRMMRLQLPAAKGSEDDDDGVTDLAKLLTAANSGGANVAAAGTGASGVDDRQQQHQQQQQTVISPRAGLATSNNNSNSNFNNANLDDSSRQQQNINNHNNNFNNDIFANIMKSSGFSEDAQLWRTVCRRLHQVLSERRLLLKTKQDGPLEFLLRTRHELAASVIQMREDVKKLNVVLNTMLEKMAGKNAANSYYNPSSSPTVNNSGNNNNNNNTVTLKMFEGSIEILQTSVSDLSHTIQRVIAGCLTDADRILLGLGNNNNNVNSPVGSLQSRYEKALSYRQSMTMRRAGANNDHEDKSIGGRLSVADSFANDTDNTNKVIRSGTPTSTNGTGRSRAMTSSTLSVGGNNNNNQSRNFSSQSASNNNAKRNDML